MEKVRKVGISILKIEKYFQKKSQEVKSLLVLSYNFHLLTMKKWINFFNKREIYFNSSSINFISDLKIISGTYFVLKKKVKLFPCCLIQEDK